MYQIANLTAKYIGFEWCQLQSESNFNDIIFNPRK